MLAAATGQGFGAEALPAMELLIFVYPVEPGHFDRDETVDKRVMCAVYGGGRASADPPERNIASEGGWQRLGEHLPGQHTHRRIQAAAHPGERD